MIFVDLFPGFCWLVWIKIEKLVRPFTYDKNQNCRENVTSTRYEGQIAKICFLNFTGRFPSNLISNDSPCHIFLIIPGQFRTKFIVIFDEKCIVILALRASDLCSRIELENVSATEVPFKSLQDAQPIFKFETNICGLLLFYAKLLFHRPKKSQKYFWEITDSGFSADFWLLMSAFLIKYSQIKIVFLQQKQSDSTIFALKCTILNSKMTICLSLGSFFADFGHFQSKPHSMFI